MENSFSSYPLRPELLRALKEIGFERPSPIQEAAIPPLLEGKDVIGRSRTGSGKTLAFLLPLLNRLNPESRRLQALVLCPTRELADQVAREARRLARHFSGFQVASLVGGTPFPPQAQALRRGAPLAVGTPGRILDHIRRSTMEAGAIGMLVLDEADRMLEMGFQEDLEAIVSTLPSRHQTALFSATFPGTLEGIRSRMKNPLQVETGEIQNRDIEQIFYPLNDGKESALLALLEERNPGSAIVFCHQKSQVDEVARLLESAGVSSSLLHGDLDQTERNKVMAQFRNKSLRVLVATDVAARGIDISGVDLVVNFDLPRPDVYVHRIGRSGRAGQPGLALSLVTKAEKKKLQEIEESGHKLKESAVPDLPLKRILAPAPMKTLYIGGGRKEKIRPGDILGALTGEAGGLPGDQVGKIEIHEHFSYVAVSRESAPQALDRLREGKVKGRKVRVEPVV